MKKLKIPKSEYTYYDDSLIDNTLDGMLKTKEKSNMGTTLYGIYKKIRIMPTYAGLGDYVILSRCVSWMRENNLIVKRIEIRQSMMYFQPSTTIKDRNQLIKTFD